MDFFVKISCSLFRKISKFKISITLLCNNLLWHFLTVNEHSLDTLYSQVLLECQLWATSFKTMEAFYQFKKIYRFRHQCHMATL